MPDSPATHTDEPAVSVRKVALAASIGATIEWYDFFLYGTASALVFNKLFFTDLPSTVGTIVALATFAVGYLARPLGAVVFGHFGDKIGRKKMLILTLLIMGCGTFCIGLLPTYGEIGVWAPILLVVMRILQGVGVGGEYGGAVLMSVEYAPAGKRGFYGSWPQVGVPAGLLLASGMFSLLTLFPQDAFLAYGWRIGFMATVVLVAIGLYVRVQVLETPAFARVQQAQAETKVPFLELLRTQPKQLLQGMGTRWIEGLTFNAYAVVAVSFATARIGVSKSTILNGVVIGAAIGVVLTPLYGKLSDRFGRKKVYGAGVVGIALFTFPSYALMMTGSTVLIWVSVALGLGVIYSAIYGPLAAYWSELFETRVRYTGVGSVYQFSGIYASGLTPLIGVALIDLGGGAPWLFAAYMVVVAAVSLAVVAVTPETYRREIVPATKAPAGGLGQATEHGDDIQVSL